MQFVMMLCYYKQAGVMVSVLCSGTNVSVVFDYPLSVASVSFCAIAMNAHYSLLLIHHSLHIAGYFWMSSLRTYQTHSFFMELASHFHWSEAHNIEKGCI